MAALKSVIARIGVFDWFLVELSVSASFWDSSIG